MWSKKFLLTIKASDIRYFFQMILQATQAENLKKDNKFLSGSLHSLNFRIEIPVQTRLFPSSPESRLKPVTSLNLKSRTDYINSQTPDKEGGL